jgi:hypothetical protein
MTGDGALGQHSDVRPGQAVKVPLWLMPPAPLRLPPLCSCLSNDGGSNLLFISLRPPCWLNTYVVNVLL